MIIRHHPNLGQVGNPIASDKVVENINKVGKEYDNVEIIAPDSGIDSWEIINMSNTVISPYTTLYIDALAKGKMALTTEYSAFRYLSKKELILNGDMSNLEEVMEGAKQVFESTEMSEYKLRAIKYAEYYYLRTSISQDMQD